ncbi:hypothetical protein KIN20_007553 [Parelaphostrongylus tenuis]|uniref:Cullin N-terminal domain-containing protein n=1 Tax=Parelaphostrongylus tenuis TaxID=148309 RepID=A0AAD5MVP4_PARTN|nr:hypothetical protein KIN20_007553 [Parelaphostrongylus tenuis]
MQSQNNGETAGCVELKSAENSSTTTATAVIPKTTTTTTTTTNTTFVLQTGAQKRSLSVFPQPPPPPPIAFPSKRQKMSDMSDEVISDEDSADIFRQAFEEGEHEYMFEHFVEGPNEDQFSNDKGCPDLIENVVDTKGVRQITRGLPTVKKLTIKNFRKKNDDVADLMASGWATLEAAINAIQKKQHITTNLEQLYKVVECLCGHKMARSTYDKLLENVRRWIRGFRSDLNEKSASGGVEFMKTVENLWSDYCEQMILIRNIFLYLDRTFILENIDESPIWESSLVIFREEIVLYSSVLKKLVNGILDCIARERVGDQIDRSLLRALFRMLRTLELYKQCFEEEFLACTNVFYAQEGMSLVRTLETTDFLLHVERRIKEENERVDLYLDESTRTPLLTRVEKCLISDHMQEVIDNGLSTLLNDNRVQDVSRLYALLCRVEGGVGLLKTGFSAYIKKVGKAMITDSQRIRPWWRI